MTEPAENAGTSGGMILVWGVIILCVAFELVLQLGDAGMIGVPRFRSLIYEYGGFWPGLLANWQPNFPYQTWSMFFTYGLLHAGLWHLGLNMLTLWSLGRIVAERVSVWKFALLYSAATLGGAAGYALLADSFRPMVGASGALFGLAGAILAWDYVDRFTLDEQLWPVARAALLLIGLNIALYYAMGGVLAWEAHLGGFLAGWVMAMIIDPRGKT